jgi:hypothetical protein
MDEHEPLAEKTHLSKFEQHRFLVMIGAAVGISLFLVSVALALYASSGTAQLDLSRPGYTSVQKQASRQDEFKSFSSSGPIDRKVIDEFRKLYDNEAKAATSVDAFGGDVMSDKVLSLDAPEEPAN